MAMTQPRPRAGGYFKPKDHGQDKAYLIEPKSWRHNATNEYKGKPTPRDEVIADIAIFKTSKSVSSSTPDEVLENVCFTNAGLTSPLKDMLEQGDENPAWVFQLEQAEMGNGRGWVFRDVDDDELRTAVETYYNNRNATRENAAASMPSFD